MKRKVIKDFKSVKLTHTSPTQSESPTIMNYNQRYLRTDEYNETYWIIIPMNIMIKIARLNGISFDGKGLLLDKEYSFEFEGLVFEGDTKLKNIIKKIKRFFTKKIRW